jgi:hypothetical protein
MEKGEKCKMLKFQTFRPAQKNKGLKAIELSAIAILMIAMFAMAPLSFAQTKQQSTAYVSATPNPIGLGQTLLVNAWVTPQPPAGFMGAPTSVLFRTGYTFTFTKPDGTTDIVTKSSYADGSTYFSYTPDAVGSWSMLFTWAGDDDFTGSQSLVNFTVQQQQVPAWPETPLPTSYWALPVNQLNREWSQLLGDWVQSGYDAAKSNFNPYSPAPNTAHILWTNDLGIGGIMGGQWGTSSYTTVTTPTVMGGRVYYSLSDGIHCVDLNTGQQLWVKEIPGWSLYYVNINQDPDPGAGGAHADIWTSPSTGTVQKYDGSTGELSGTYTDQSAGISAYDGTNFYYNNGTHLIKWNPYSIGTAGYGKATFNDKIIDRKSVV